MFYEVFYSEKNQSYFQWRRRFVSFSGELLDGGLINLFGPTLHTVVGLTLHTAVIPTLRTTVGLTLHTAVV